MSVEIAGAERVAEDTLDSGGGHLAMRERSRRRSGLTVVPLTCRCAFDFALRWRAEVKPARRGCVGNRDAL